MKIKEIKNVDAVLQKREVAHAILTGIAATAASRYAHGDGTE